MWNIANHFTIFSQSIFKSDICHTHWHIHTHTHTCIDVRQVHTLITCVGISSAARPRFLFLLHMLSFFVCTLVVALFFRCFTCRSMCLQNIKTTTTSRRKRRRKKKTKAKAKQATLTAKLLSVSLSSCAQSFFNTHTHEETHKHTHAHRHTIYKGLAPSGLSLSLSHSLWLLLWHKILFALLNFYFQFNFLAWRFDPAANLMPSLIRPMRLPRLQFKQ